MRFLTFAYGGLNLSYKRIRCRQRKGMKTMKNNLTGLKVLNAFALIAMIVVNMLAQVLPLGGKTTAEISASYPTLLTPIGLSFSIWFVIYVAMTWFVAQQIFSKDNTATKEIGPLFAISCGLNIAWIFSWHYEQMLLAMISIIGLWLILMLIDSKMGDEKWYLKGGFAIYYAWITAATAIQIFIYFSNLLDISNGGMPSVAITVGAIVALTTFALEKILRERDDFFGFTIAWALLGVLLTQVNGEVATAYRIVEIVTAFGLLLIIMARVWLKPKMAEI